MPNVEVPRGEENKGTGERGQRGWGNGRWNEVGGELRAGCERHKGGRGRGLDENGGCVYGRV